LELVARARVWVLGTGVGPLTLSLTECQCSEHKKLEEETFHSFNSSLSINLTRGRRGIYKPPSPLDSLPKLEYIHGKKGGATKFEWDKET